MSEENMQVIPSVGMYIENKKGELLLVKSHKWDDKYAVPGGKIKYGETAVQAVERELYEEVGLKAKSVEFVDNIDMIKDPEFIYKPEAHYVSRRFQVIVSNTDVVLNNEAESFEWVAPEEILKRDDVVTIVKDYVKQHMLSKENKKTNKKVLELEEKIEEYKSGWQRAQADYKNLQTEIENKRSEWVKMSELQVLEDFIPVYDNFKKAFSHHPELDSENEKDKKVKNWVDGIGYIMKQFSDVLKRFEIEEIKTVGEMFNPEFHEAVGEEDSEEIEGKILREIDVGYTMKGKVIKVAKVIISKNSNNK
ncbi:MAG: nucleotide exchange factor GrpE [Candidatus Magasanikbacteria bacterium]